MTANTPISIRQLALLLLCPALLHCGDPSLPEPEQPASAISEWTDYGGDRGGQRYVALDLITPDNVGSLAHAWTYRHGDVSAGTPEIPSTSAFQNTPILVDGTLYLCTPFNRVIALDPATGAERWVHDPEIDLTGRYANQLVCRGVAFWRNAAVAPEARCARTIFTATNDARLIALDAASGEKCAGFGEEGEIDLNAGAGEQRWQGEYHVTSAPVVVRGRVVVGSAIGDNVRTDAPSGVLRAYDARTGALGWAWDLAPPGFDYQAGPTSDAGYALGTPNVWAPMSVDEERGLVFIAAAMDDSLRAFDSESGEELWQVRLPAGGQATPMSYRIAFEDGSVRQYVVIAAGGHGRAGTKLGDSLVAFALEK